MSTIILGLNAYHADSAACVVVDGKIRAAAEEERFRRVKHWAGLPTEAIRYCLREVGAQVSDVDHIAVNSDPGANLLRKAAYAASSLVSPRRIADRIRNLRKRASIRDELAQAFELPLTAEVHAIEHHLAHLASAYYCAPFKDAVAVSIDGFGDFSSTAWGFGSKARVEVDGRILFPHSLGIFYQALTQYLGFPHYGDEYKIMGLAPYGKPQYLNEMRDIVQTAGDGTFKLNLKYFRHHRERFDYAWSDGEPKVGSLYSEALEELLGPARAKDEPLSDRHRDLARSVQARYEEVFFDVLDMTYKRYSCDKVVLAGGCAMNSVANGKLRRRTQFRHSYVQSAAGDAGGAVGAALEVYRRVNGGGANNAMPHAYLGPKFPADQVRQLIDGNREQIREAGCRVDRFESSRDLCMRTAELVAGGAVVGWFQGRMEWGPRALGNRSILGDPRRADMKDILNLKIKRRESFRPFAPSILREHVAEWFEEEDDVPFMMQVFQIRKEKRALIPAVTHVDGSGRLQTISRQHNPLYHDLVSSFRELTGVPLVLNTSFNENEPVVCVPGEALACFLRTRMDALVLGSAMISR